MTSVTTELGHITKITGGEAIANVANTSLLASCYRSSLKAAMEHGVRMIAFPSISTSIYHFPVDLAAKTAVREVRAFLEEPPDAFESILWVLFNEKTKRPYDAALQSQGG